MPTLGFTLFEGLKTPYGKFWIEKCECSATGIKDFLEGFDFPYRIRKYHRLIEVVEQLLGIEEITEADKGKIGEKLGLLWRYLEKIRMMEWRIWSIEDEEPQGWFRQQLLYLKRDLEKEVSNINEIILTPLAQASSTQVYRKEK